MAEDYNHKQDGSRSVSLNELTKDELVSEVLRLRGQLKKKDSFGLVFERQKEDAIINRAKSIPVLKENTSKYVDNGGEDNLLLIGDNFDSLTCLLETSKGKIDVIYIDPPYNTRKKDFIYNDTYVNPEDSFIHSKWLSFMEKRLDMCRELMSEQGVIFISIDDNEQAELKLLCNSIFGEPNFVAQFIWENNPKGRKNGTFHAQSTEYILAYTKNNLLWFKESGLEFTKALSSKDEREVFYDDRGEYRKSGRQLMGKSSNPLAKTNPKRCFSIYHNFDTGHSVVLDEYDKESDSFVDVPKAKELLNEGYTCYRPTHRTKKLPNIVTYTKETVEDMIASNDLFFLKDSIYGKERDFNQKIKSLLTVENTGKSILNRTAGEYIKTILSIDDESPFSFPKPVPLISLLVNLYPKKNATVLDFFAGSGTTGHAVLELNKEDGGNRKFILCTNDEAGIGETVTYERIKRVITGKNWADGKEHESHEASLRYFNVGFIERANIAKELADNVDSLINIAENCFKEVVIEDMFKVWKNNNNHYAALIKDSWGIESFIESLIEAEPSTISVYVNDNGADYRIELEPFQKAGWDVDYISLNDFILDVIAFVDEKVGVSIGGNDSSELYNQSTGELVDEENGESN